MLRHLVLNTFAGWVAGTLCSLGGALKDSPLEGFKRATFPRSMVVATLWGVVSTAVTADFFLAFAFAGYFERLTVEGWKIMRAKRPSKFVTGGWVSEWGNNRRAVSAPSGSEMLSSLERLHEWEDRISRPSPADIPEKG